MSSGLPRFLISGDGVEDGQELSHASDGGDHFGFAGGDQALAKGPDDRIMTGGREGGDEQSGAHAGAAAADEGLTAPFAGLPGERRQAGQAGDLAAIELAEFGQFGDQGTGGNGAEAGNRGETAFPLTPGQATRARRTQLAIE